MNIETYPFMMKIAFTSDYFYPSTGGAEQSCLELAKAIKKRGHEVVVFTRNGIKSDQIEGVHVERVFKTLSNLTFNRDIIFPRIVDLKEKKRLIHKIEGEDIDILHSNNRDTAIFTAKVGRKLSIKTVAHIRDYWPVCPKRDFLKKSHICSGPKYCSICMSTYYNKWLKFPFYFKSRIDTNYRLKEIERYVDHYVYNSNFIKKKIRLDPGTVIYNPIDTNSVRIKEKEEGKILFIGNVTKRKGIDILARAVERLDVELHIVGEGYLLDKIKGKNIIKHGRLDYKDVLDHLSTSSVLVVPSVWPEPFGRVAVEGMALGCAVIVSPYGALPEVVGEGGFVLDQVDEKSIKYAISNILDDTSLRKRLIKRGVVRSKKFKPEKIAGQMIELYSDLLNQK
ncbi:MAG: glycosyltransferase family 4 protein [Thermoplasmatota archaeon]